VAQPLSASHQRAIDAALWAMTLACGLLTIWLSFGITPPGSEAFPGADKVEHGIAYFLTTSFLFLAAIWRPGRGYGPLARVEVWLAVAVVLAGGLVEILQGAYTTDRQADVLDWLVEIIAVVVVVAVNRAWRVHNAATEATGDLPGS
jgi:VanZ family protein